MKDPKMPQSGDAQEPVLDSAKDIMGQIRQDLDAVEASLGRAIPGQESIVDGATDKLKEAAEILKRVKGFVEVL